MALTALVVAGTTAIVYARAWRVEHESLRSELRIRAGALAQALSIDDEGLDFEAGAKSLPEYQREGSGVYAVVRDPQGAEVLVSPSLAGGTLRDDGDWRDGEFRFAEVEAGPAGRPIEVVAHSVLVPIESDPEEMETPPPEGYEPPPAAARRYTVLVGMDVGERDGELAELLEFLMLVTGCGIAVAAGGGLLVSKRVLGPIRRMTEEAARLTPEDPTRRLPPAAVVAELESLASTLNRALDRLADALEQQRRFTSDAGHELRTPLSILLSGTELLLRRERRPEEYREGLERQLRVARRMRDIVERLLVLARADAHPGDMRQPFSPGPLVASLIDDFEPLARSRGVRVDFRRNADPTISGDPELFGQLVQNLLSNALKFARGDGRVTVTLDVENGQTVLAVADDGPGVPPEHRERIFHRFHRVDEGRDSREGAGLGLAIVARAAALHGGTVSVNGPPGAGATFTIRIPVAVASPVTPAGIS